MNTIGLKLVMCKGLPGSGKSTWAQNEVDAAPLGTLIRVNKDDIRSRVNSTWSRDVEKEVIRKRDFDIALGLSQGKSVISDDTNFAPKHETRLRAIALKWGAAFEVKDFTEVPIEVCIERDSKREDKARVGEKVIRAMWTQYLAPREVISNPYVRDYSKPKALIVDIDGTLALHTGRSPYDVEKCKTDVLNDPIDDIIHTFHDNEGHAIIYMSGREDKFFDLTQEWLNENLCPKGPLRMRLTGDTRNDAVVKLELFDRCVRDYYNVSFVLDDRDRVVKMWRDLGLTCLQVAYGDF